MTFEEVFQEHSVDYRSPGEHHHAHGEWIQTDCPYCSPGWSSFRLGWHTRKRYANCYVCGPQRTGETLALLLRIPPDEAMKLARALRSEDPHPSVQCKDIRGTLVIPPGLNRLAPAHRRYLEKRGFNPKEIVKTWDVEAFRIAGRYSWRLFIPIHDRSGKVVSWTTRSIAENTGHRYIRARAKQEEVNANYLLYGEHLVPGHAVVVHEGHLDAWATGPGSTALGGLNVSMQQVYKIAQYPVRVICLDNEPDAQKVADALCEQLAPMPGETIRVQLQHGKDAADCLLSRKGRAELEELREKFLYQESENG